jgi:hypothetical protein
MSGIFGNAAATTPSADPTAAFIESLKPAAQAQGTTTTKPERKPSQFWLNVGIVVPGMGEDGSDVFVTLPVGIALDDLKKIEVKGSNPNWVKLQQAKNQFMELIGAQAAALAPGERKILPRIVVEVARVAAPNQQADSSNALAVALTQQFAAG